jgi:hypothetical protein
MPKRSTVAGAMPQDHHVKGKEQKLVSKENLPNFSNR